MMNDPDELLKPSELAKRLRVSQAHVYNLIKQRIIPTIAVGKIAVRLQWGEVMQALKEKNKYTRE